MVFWYVASSFRWFVPVAAGFVADSAALAAAGDDGARPGAIAVNGAVMPADCDANGMIVAVDAADDDDAYPVLDDGRCLGNFSIDLMCFCSLHARRNGKKNHEKKNDELRNVSFAPIEE